MVVASAVAQRVSVRKASSEADVERKRDGREER